MSVRLLCLSAAAGIILTACATSQENPNYQVSTQYKGSNPYAATAQPQGTVSTVRYSPVTSTATTTPASTQQTRTVYESQSGASTQYRTVDQQPVQYRTITAGTGYTQVDQQCLNAEKKRELLGGAIGGTIGAFAGKELIGGTKGTIAGATLGGAAGYGLGDKSINCDPVYVQPQPAVTQSYYQPNYQAQPGTGQVYANQSYQTPASTQYTPTQPQYQQTAPANNAGGTPGYYAVNGGQAPMQVQPPVQPQQVYAEQQTVYVPLTLQQAVTQTAAPTPQFVYTAQSTGMHQVVEGDTVYSMSKQLCVSVDDIQRINGLDSNYNIKLGQYLQLPASRCVR